MAMKPWKAQCRVGVFVSLPSWLEMPSWVAFLGEAPTYGYRRLTALLKRQGDKVNHKRVARSFRLLSESRGALQLLALCPKIRSHFIRLSKNVLALNNPHLPRKNHPFRQFADLASFYLAYLVLDGVERDHPYISFARVSSKVQFR